MKKLSLLLESIRYFLNIKDCQQFIQCSSFQMGEADAEIKYTFT